MPPQPLSEPPRPPRLYRFFLPAIGAVFLLAGCLMLWLLFIQPLRQVLEARSWTPTECKILQSSVEVKSDGDGTSYKPRIVYEYLAEGNRYNSNRYDFFPMSSSRQWAEKIVAQYQTGTTHRCYFDPANPSEAVLLIDFSGIGFLFGALFPWLFIGVGGMLLFFGSRSPTPQSLPPLNDEETALENRLLNSGLSQATSPGSSGDSATSAEPRHSSIPDSQTKRATPRPYSERANWQEFAGPQKLRPTTSRIGTVIGIGLFALFWNAFVGMFTYNALDQGRWFSLLFLAPFLIAGVFLIGVTIYSFLKLFNPTVELAISEGAVPLGDSIDVAWELKGRVRRIRELVISAVAEEQATYTRGTDTRTDNSIFQKIEIARTSAVADIQFGTATLAIPPDTMHTHSGDQNKIVWKLLVEGQIPFFPNLHEEFVFRVIPRGDA